MKPPDVLIDDSLESMPIKPDPIGASGNQATCDRVKLISGSNPLIGGTIMPLQPKSNASHIKRPIVMYRGFAPSETSAFVQQQRSAFAKYAAPLPDVRSPDSTTFDRANDNGRVKILQKREPMDFLDNGVTIWNELSDDNFEISGAISDEPMEMEFSDDAWPQSV